MNTHHVRILGAVSVFGIAFAAALGQLASSSVLASDSPQISSLNVPPVAGPNRPANVPDGYVITPFGYFHSSCVQSLAKGERLLVNGRIQHGDGSVEDKVAVCNYPRFTPSGILVKAATAPRTTPQVKSPTANTSAEVNGWIEQESITTGSATQSYGALIAAWAVPSQPIANDGQVLFLYPGFEDINNTESILQPVLQWVGGQWAIASWNCCLNNITTESPVVDVSPGDEIYGSITSTCPPGTLSCPTWNVLSLDISTGESTTLSDTPSAGQRFNWAFAGVLEPYYVITCDDYPPNRQITFDNETFNEYLRPITNPKWGGSANTTQTPQCNYGVKATPHAVTLRY